MWLPLAPTRLYDFDAANFALALDSFQPAAHQPQPPGYPLYVALTRVVHGLVSDVSLTFLFAGMLGAGVTARLLGMLGERMFGRRAGVFAALLFLTNPIVWQTGLTNQVRIYLALISTAVALAAWPLYSSGGDAKTQTRRLAGTSFLLGLLAGFRPEMLVALMAVPLVAAIRMRPRFRACAIALTAIGVGAMPWFVPLVERVGGIGAFLRMMQGYSAAQAGKTSVLFGASWAGALGMFAATLWWVSLGVAAWLPATLLIRWPLKDLRRQLRFLLVWFVPLVLFAVLIHMAASGHALSFIPVLCLVGGWVLSSVAALRSRKVAVLFIAGALCLNVTFFFKPYAKGVKEASYKTVGVIRGINESTLQKIDTIASADPTYIVTDGRWLSWRMLEYYYPQIPVLFLPAPTATLQNPPPVWLLRNRQLAGSPEQTSELAVPACGTIIWMVSDDASRGKLLALEDANAQRFFISTDGKPGMHYKIGRYRLASSTSLCGQGSR